MPKGETLADGRRQRRALAGPLVVLAVVTVAVALLGVPGGFIWSAITPRVLVVVTGQGVAQVVNPETKAFIAADGWFCVVGMLGGLLAGAVGYVTAVRRRGAAAAAGLILGGLAASLVQWWIGRDIGRASFRGALYVSHHGAVLHAPLELSARTALVIWPLTASLLVGLDELVAGRPRDRPGRPGAGTPGSAAPPRTI